MIYAKSIKEIRGKVSAGFQLSNTLMKPVWKILYNESCFWGQVKDLRTIRRVTFSLPTDS